MTDDRLPIDETTAPLAPQPPRSNVVLSRGSEEIEVTVDGQWLPRQRTFVKVYYDLAADVLAKVKSGPFCTLLFISRFAHERDGRLVIEKSTRQLAAELGMNRTTLVDHLGVLQAHGYVSNEQERYHGTFSKSRWTINWTSGVDRFNVNAPAEETEDGEGEQRDLSPVVGEAFAAVDDRGQEIPTTAESPCKPPWTGKESTVKGETSPWSPLTVDGESGPREAETESPCSESGLVLPSTAETVHGGPRPQTEEVVVAKSGTNNNRETLQALHELAVQGLRANGVGEAVIAQLLADPGVDECLRQLVALDYRIAAKANTADPVRSRPGFLVRSIQEGWSDPPEVKALQQQAEEERRRQAEAERELADEQRRLRRERELDEALAALAPLEAAALEEEILAELTAPGAIYEKLFQLQPALLETTKRQRLRERLLGPDARAA